MSEVEKLLHPVFTAVCIWGVDVQFDKWLKRNKPKGMGHHLNVSLLADHTRTVRSVRVVHLDNQAREVSAFEAYTDSQGVHVVES